MEQALAIARVLLSTRRLYGDVSGMFSFLQNNPIRAAGYMVEGLASGIVPASLVWRLCIFAAPLHSRLATSPRRPSTPPTANVAPSRGGGHAKATARSQKKDTTGHGLRNSREKARLLHATSLVAVFLFCLSFSVRLFFVRLAPSAFSPSRLQIGSHFLVPSHSGQSHAAISAPTARQAVCVCAFILLCLPGVGGSGWAA